MLAVVESGGKQYLVKEGSVLKIEKVDAGVGQEIDLGRVLMIKQSDGSALSFSPSGASIKAVVLEQAKAKKIIVFKKHRRKNYRRKRGHRQCLTVVRVVRVDV